MKPKLIWYFLMANALVLWGAVIALGLYLFPENRTLGALGLFLLVLAIHVSEIPVAYKIGTGKKLSAPRTILKTLVFGFTWWVPLKKGIIDN